MKIHVPHLPTPCKIIRDRLLVDAKGKEREPVRMRGNSGSEIQSQYMTPIHTDFQTRRIPSLFGHRPKHNYLVTHP